MQKKIKIIIKGKKKIIIQIMIREEKLYILCFICLSKSRINEKALTAADNIKLNIVILTLMLKSNRTSAKQFRW